MCHEPAFFARIELGRGGDAWPGWLIASVGADSLSPTEFWNTVTEPQSVGPDENSRPENCVENAITAG